MQRPWFIANYHDGSPMGISESREALEAHLISKEYEFVEWDTMNDHGIWRLPRDTNTKYPVFLYKLTDRTENVIH